MRNRFCSNCIILWKFKSVICNEFGFKKFKIVFSLSFLINDRKKCDGAYNSFLCNTSFWYLVLQVYLSSWNVYLHIKISYL